MVVQLMHVGLFFFFFFSGMPLVEQGAREVNPTNIMNIHIRRHLSLSPRRSLIKILPYLVLGVLLFLCYLICIQLDSILYFQCLICKVGCLLATKSVSFFLPYPMFKQVGIGPRVASQNPRSRGDASPTLMLRQHPIRTTKCITNYHWRRSLPSAP